MKRRPVHVLLVLAVGTCSLGALTIARAALPECAIPTLHAPAFSARDRNHLEWTQPTGALQGGGFTLEIAYDPRLAPSGGGFAATVDDEPNIWRILNFSSGTRSVDVEELAERTHYYHIRVKSSGTCATPLDPWSPIVSTTQDATGPQVSFETPDLQPFALGGATITGVAVDEPADGAGAASGAKSVQLVVDNTTPVAGQLLGSLDSMTVPVAEDGTWEAVFEDPAPGTYRVTATAYDMVGNGSAEQPSITIVVL